MSNIDSKDSKKGAIEVSPAQRAYMEKVTREMEDSLRKMAHAFEHIANQSIKKTVDFNNVHSKLTAFVRRLHDVSKKEEIDPLIMLAGYIAYFDEMLKRVCAMEVGKTRAEIEEMIEKDIMDAEFNPPGLHEALDGEERKIH